MKASLSVFEYGIAVQEVGLILAAHGGHSIADILSMANGDTSCASTTGYAMAEKEAASILRHILGIYRSVERSFHWFLFADNKRRALQRLKYLYPGMEQLVTTPGIDTLLARTAAAP